MDRFEYYKASYEMPNLEAEIAKAINWFMIERNPDEPGLYMVHVRANGQVAVVRGGMFMDYDYVYPLGVLIAPNDKGQLLADEDSIAETVKNWREWFAKTDETPEEEENYEPLDEDTYDADKFLRDLGEDLSMFDNDTYTPPE